MKKLFGNLLLLAVIAGVVSFFLAPAVGFFAIRSAADANDVAGLSRLIDFAAVRQSLRPQLSGNPAAMAPAPSFMEDPIGAVRRQLEQASPAAAPDVDVYLTPAALGALTRGEGRYASQRTGAAPETERTNPMPGPVFWSINRARMAVTDEGGSRTIFTFERRGPFEWKLVHIGLPEGVAPAPGPAPPTVGHSGGKGG
ncbi:MULTISPECIES: DUF2939 domain-containing protein [unclassified Brevundimonas]|uniref:DUF2939 domain-containing protein n=1 Tax=unclassified Brevundimonas TaxID=2622653 RepID=UPI0006FDD133|nr:MULTISPECIES: DUF2939 domain-containing protein [unclassified Brevundimonas]KQY85241.1 hypothetical protein ASD25_23780 [Brevundimonas sp. Root1423]KRA28732.1 hypothetical protein ASD59_02635 [Brevundimonas sp. Root608]